MNKALDYVGIISVRQLFHNRGVFLRSSLTPSLEGPLTYWSSRHIKKWEWRTVAGWANCSVQRRVRIGSTQRARRMESRRSWGKAKTFGDRLGEGGLGVRQNCLMRICFSLQIGKWTPSSVFPLKPQLSLCCSFMLFCGWALFGQFSEELCPGWERD